MKKLLLSMAAVMAAGVASAQWQKPMYGGGYQPLTVDETVYIYNVEAKQFLTEGNDWGTHATVGDMGLECKVVEAVPSTVDSETEPTWDGKTYNIQINSKAKGGWNDMFITDGGNLYVDHREQADYFFEFKALGNNTYNIYGADVNPVWNHKDDYASWLVGHYTLYRDVKNDAETGTGVIYGDTGADSEFEPGTFNATWAFVSAEDYEAYLAKIETYEAAMGLKELIDEAKGMGIDVAAAEAVYANTASTTDELDAAAEALNEAMLKYYETSVTPDNPMNLTRLIENPTCDNTSGWINGMEAKTWETANMSAGWQTGWEEGAFTDSYLNIWDANCEGSVFQQLTGIPNGIYVFRISALAEKEGAMVFANENARAIPADSKGRAYSITTNVTDGTLAFGIMQNVAGTNWLCMDNASLLYYGSGLDAYKHWLAELKETAPDMSEVEAQQALIDEYNTIIARVDAAQTEEEILAVVKDYQDIIDRINANVQAYDDLKEAMDKAQEVAAEANTYYGETIGDFCIETVQPAVEAHALSTEEVNALIAQLQGMADEAQQYIWNMEKLATEVEKAAAVYEEHSTTCSPEAEAAYVAFMDKYDALDASRLTADDVDKLINELYAIEFELQKSTDPASDDNPVDYTAKIYNPSFTAGAEGWTNESWGTFGNNKDAWAPATNEEGALSDDGLYLNLWNAGNAYACQDIAQLPVGAYTLTFGAYADAEGLQIGVNGNTVDIPAGQTPEGLYLRLYSIDFVVTELMSYGAHITISNVGGGTVWAMVDEFRLAYKGTESEIVQNINSISSSATTSAIYTLSGTRVNAMQRGVNIVRMSDGSVKKVIK